MLPSDCFRTGRRSLTQSSVKAVHGQDSKWMSGSIHHGNRRREARTRAEGPEKPVSRAPPERVRRAFALLTRTHHGGRLTRKVSAFHRGDCSCEVGLWQVISPLGIVS